MIRAFSWTADLYPGSRLVSEKKLFKKNLFLTYLATFMLLAKDTELGLKLRNYNNAYFSMTHKKKETVSK